MTKNVYLETESRCGSIGFSVCNTWKICSVCRSATPELRIVLQTARRGNKILADFEKASGHSPDTANAFWVSNVLALRRGEGDNSEA